LNILRNILPLLTTDTMGKIFHELHIRLLAHLMVSNHQARLAAHTITLQGGQKLQELERGCSTHGTDEPVANSLIDLKFFMKRDFDLDSAIDRPCELARNSGADLS
jgi:hypothetical protein